ncbi:MAG: hypothetical protein ACRBCL_10805 [Maritimibacter sp.]
MQYLEGIADKLANEVLDVIEATGNEDVVDDVKKIIGTSSTTLEEAYMTAVRVRRAERRATEMLSKLRETAQ